jgi:dTMP kinase
MSKPFPYQRLAGKFIVFDGPDGCGKTTQMELLQTRAEQTGIVVRRLREPGGTPIGEQIRDVLLATKNEGMDIRCEMLLYMASRAQLVQQEIRPALHAGDLVLSDRYASSTLAYQGAAGGLPLEAILQVATIAVDGVWPDLTVIFDISIEAAFERLNPLYGKGAMGMSQGGLFQDRIEQRDRSYHQRVRTGFLEQAQRWPERYRVVDASRAIFQVEDQVTKVVAEFFSDPKT